MSTYKIQGSTLTDIADAIRRKTGGHNMITVSSMPSAIDSIPTGGSTDPLPQPQIAMLCDTQTTASSSKNITLNGNISNFPFICVVMGDDTRTQSFMVSVNMLTMGNRYEFTFDALTRYITVTFVNSTTIRFYSATSGCRLIGLYGIKYGSNYTQTEIFKTSDLKALNGVEGSVISFSQSIDNFDIISVLYRLESSLYGFKSFRAKDFFRNKNTSASTYIIEPMEFEENCYKEFPYTANACVKYTPNDSKTEMTCTLGTTNQYFGVQWITGTKIQ